MAEKIVINFRNYGIRFVLLLIVLFVMFKIYQWVNRCSTCEQRVYSSVRINSSRDYKLILTAVSDVTMPKNDIFQFNFPTNFSFKSVFESKKEKDKMKSLAAEFFKNTFGLTDLHLKPFMWELRVNDKLDYRFVPGNEALVDGGYVCYIPKNTLLKGTYGGPLGVRAKEGGIVTFGYYIGGGYKIRYWSMSPLITHSAYDGDYTPIDCDLEIEDASDKSLIGLKGKSQGMYKIINYKGLSNRVTIRNIMTFF